MGFLWANVVAGAAVHPVAAWIWRCCLCAGSLITMTPLEREGMAAAGTATACPVQLSLIFRLQKARTISFLKTPFSPPFKCQLEEKYSGMNYKWKGLAASGSGERGWRWDFTYIQGFEISRSFWGKGKDLAAFSASSLGWERCSNWPSEYSTISRCKSQRLIAFWALKSCLVKIRVRGRILSKKQLQVSQGFLGERGLGKGSKTRATPWADEP